MIIDKLPASHYTVDEVVKMLEKHTKANPVVDLDFLVNNLDVMNTARNFTIKLVQKDGNGKLYSPYHIVAVVQNNRDFEVLKDAIKKAKKRVDHVDVKPEEKVNKITTQVDDLAGSTPTARINTKSKAKYGSKMKGGELTVEKAEDVA